MDGESMGVFQVDTLSKSYFPGRVGSSWMAITSEEKCTILVVRKAGCYNN
ncbi:hypothetical protein HanHA300_Chr13g0493161 [Helianthus annuus]|nr:hypothetical protein HanHA300_Chr13g0493161 [Helianthus annuus]KAJ0664683.1 hypothetical protein HanLR1_Chr13g0495261 [Helianthus annuus]KAJ0672133.1 hypothetical protein HanOQP8_Chr13g0493571 [Helianthus annuus]